MSDALLNIYHRLPPSARNIAAGLRGMYLRSWRYGKTSDQLIDQAARRESWDEVEWQKWQSEKLQYLLQRAVTRVPYYRDYWSTRAKEPSQPDWTDLSRWPILSKESIRAGPQRFIADDMMPARMFHEHTSGTTGKPLDLWWSKETVQQWYALFERRARQWHGVTRSNAWAILGGQPVIPASAHRPPFWVWNAPMRQLYLSANHISPGNARYFCDAIEKYSVTHLVAYSSSAAALAYEFTVLGIRPKGIRTVITNAEPLLPWQRDLIRQGFGCEARETYGMAEIALAASECECGSLHLWPEVGVMEILSDDSDQPVAPGESGRLVCTGLLNVDMPLIRYETGDRIRMPENKIDCECGRRLPVIGQIEGRMNDLITTPDGRRVYWLNPVFYELPVREAQIIQKTVQEITVYYVPVPDFDYSTLAIIESRLRSRLGEMQITFEQVPAIPREKNGKFRAVVSNLQAN